MNDSAVLLTGETRCWSLLGFKGLNRRRWGVSQAAVDRQQPAFDETFLLQSNCDNQHHSIITRLGGEMP